MNFQKTPVLLENYFSHIKQVQTFLYDFSSHFSPMLSFLSIEAVFLFLFSKVGLHIRALEIPMLGRGKGSCRATMVSGQWILLAPEAAYLRIPRVPFSIPSHQLLMDEKDEFGI